MNVISREISLPFEKSPYKEINVPSLSTVNEMVNNGLRVAREIRLTLEECRFGLCKGRL